MELIKVEIVRECRGSVDGLTVQLFEAGKQYDLPIGLASRLISGSDAMIVQANDKKKPKTDPIASDQV